MVIVGFILINFRLLLFLLFPAVHRSQTPQKHFGNDFYDKEDDEKPVFDDEEEEEYGEEDKAPSGDTIPNLYT